MNLQSTMLAVLASALLSVGAYFAGHWKGYSDGQRTERLAWQTRESEELATANVKLIQAQVRAAELEREAGERIAAIDAAHQQEAKRVQARHSQFVADLYAGRIRLPVDPARQGSCGSATSPLGEPARVDARASEPDISGSLREALAEGHRLAGEADAVALRLNGLQEYYRTVVIPACR